MNATAFSEMEHMRPILSGLTTCVLAYAIVTGAIHLLVPRSPDQSPPSQLATKADFREAPDRPILSRGSVESTDAMIEIAKRSPQDRLSLAKSLSQLSTSQLQEALDASFTGHPYDGNELRNLLVEEWADRDPAAAAEWATKRHTSYFRTIAVIWATKDPDGFGREILQKIPYSADTPHEYGEMGRSFYEIGKQDLLLLAKVMTYNQGKERSVNQEDKAFGAPEIALSTPEEIKRVAHGLPAQMKFAAPGQPDPPEMFTSNQILEITARRYSEIDPAGYESWLRVLPEGARMKVMNAVNMAAMEE